MQIFGLKNQAGQEWVGYITDDKIMFLPVAVFGNSDVIYFCGAVDGAPMLQDAQGLTYLPADWLAAEFPKYRQPIEKLKKQIGLET